MLLPWLLLSILPSIGLSSFADVKFRKKIGTILKLGSLSYDENDEEVLLNACGSGHQALVETILAQPTKSTILNKTSRYGNTGFHMACRRGRLEVVKVLLEQPTINLHAKNNEGFTPLLLLGDSNLEIENILIPLDKFLLQDKLRFQIIFVNEDGSEEWKYINKSGQDKIIKVNSSKIVKSIRNNTLFPEDVNNTVTKSDLLPPEENGRKFLDACKHGDSNMVAKFLKCANASVLNETDYGMTGLHAACLDNNQEIVEMIVAKKESNINIKDKYGRNALYYCIYHEGTAKILLESGKLKFEEMNGIEHFTENEDGSIEFEYTDAWKLNKWRVKMKSGTKVESIKDISDFK